MTAINKYLLLGTVFCMALTPVAARAQMESDFSSGGAVRVGDSTTTCAAGAAGAIRFNDAGGDTLDYCDGSTWTILQTTSDLIDADGDTKIEVEESADDDIIRFDTAGSERMVISATGNVGIGAASPSEKLHIEGNMRFTNSGSKILVGNASHFIEPQTTNGDINLASVGGVTFNIDSDNNGTTHVFSVNKDSIDETGPSLFMIRESGNVGIGTASPKSKLHIEGVTDASLLDGSGVLIIGPEGGLNIVIDDNEIIARNNAAGSDLYLQNGAGVGNTILNSVSGRVGIGYGAPRTALDVNGTIMAGDVSSSTNGSLAFGISYNSPGDIVNTLGSYYSTSAMALGFAVRPKNGGGGYVSSADNISWTRGVAEVSNQFVFRNAAAIAATVGDDVTLTERFRINADGNVGIGTPGPVRKLEVIGDMRVGNGGGYEDLVMETSSDGFTNGGFVFRPRTIPGSGIANFYTYFKASAFGSGTTNHHVVIDGNVGIGTTAPAGPLHVERNHAGLVRSRFTNPNTDAYQQTDIQIGRGTALNDIFLGTNYLNTPNGFLDNRTGGAFVFRNTGNLAMAINTNGYIGLGTAAPTARLDVRGKIRSGLNAATYSDFNGSSSNDLDITANAGASNVDPNIKFLLSDSGGAIQEKMRIATDGDVGIGTTAPTTRLDIVDDTNGGYDGLYYRQLKLSNGTTGTSVLNAGTITSIGSYIGFDSGYSSSFLYQSNKTVGGGIKYENNRIDFYNDTGLTIGANYNPTERLSILSTGAVGVGTTAPSAGLLLDVDGKIGATEYCDENGANCITAVALGGTNSIDDLGDAERDDTNNNLFIGETYGSALANNDYNTSLGIHALESLSNTATTNHGDWNTAVGSLSLRNNTEGYSNTAVGYTTLSLNTTGAANTAMGVNVLRTNTTGSNNVGVGTNVLYTNSTGQLNAGIGVNALYSNTTGGGNSAVGVNALYNNTTGVSNVGVGANAGRYIADGTTANVTSGTSVFLGGETKSSADGVGNEIVIGYNAIGNGSNSATLGNDSITTTVLKGNVGIGTAAPTSKLDILGGALNVRTGSSIDVSVNANSGFVVENENVPGGWARGLIAASSGVAQAGAGFLGNAQTTTAYHIGFGTSWWALNSKMTIMPSGNVGIGTTTPAVPLHVSDPSDVPAIFASTDSSSNVAIADSNGSVGLKTQSGAFILQTGGDANTFTNQTEVMRVTSAGNVGIGTTTPAQKLHVDGVARFSGDTASNWLDIDASAGSGNDVELSSRFNSIWFDVPGSNNTAYNWKIGGAHVMRVDESGKLGIGTTVPEGLLELSANDTIDYSGSFNVYTDTPKLLISEGTNIATTPSSIAAIGFKAGNTGVAEGFIGLHRTGNNAGALVFGASSGASRTEKMRINHLGRVGIGTDDPASTLDVNGGTFIRGTSSQLRIKETDAPDPEDGFHFSVNSGNLLFIHEDNSAGPAYTTGLVIEPSGDVGIGTTAPGSKLHVRDGSVLVSDNSNAVNGSFSSDWNRTYMHPNGYFWSSIETGNTETNLYLHRHESTGDFALFGYGASAVGSISTNGTSVTYNTTSDYRLKDGIVGIDDALSRIDQLKPSRFYFKADKDKILVDGFIAHNVQAIAPYAVTGEKDEVNDDGTPIYQQVDYSKITPLLTKAIQELRQENIELREQNKNIMRRLDVLESAQ